MVISVSLQEESYNIYIERGALARAGELLHLARRVLVVTDSGVPAAYAAAVAGACELAQICTLPAGESSKSFESYQLLLRAMLRLGMTRGDCVAAVGGGIPWLVNLERCKRLDRVVSVGGIMNGTSNFIMDAMHASPVSFPDILKKAQDLGYAEADPSADIDGDDIRRKLAISANVAFDALIDEEAIPTFGIRTVTDGDIAAFQRRGFVCKLLAAAQLSKEGICAWIEPTLVESHALEAAVPQNFNLITYYGESIGRQSFFGQGAGRYPTAYNVVQDCIDILCGQRSFYAADMAPAHLDLAGEAHPYYVRTEGHDDWLDSITVDRWEEGVITSAVSVGKMIAWAKHRLKADPTCFIAGIR